MKKFLLAASGALLFTASLATASDVPPTPPAKEVPAAPIAKCTSCHGADLNGKGKTPAIAGESLAEIKESLTTKIPKQMTAVAKSLSAEQIDALAAESYAMPPPPAQ